MSQRIDFSTKFDKQLRKVPLEIKQSLRKRLEIFISDQYHPLLDNHALTGNYQGLRSINITGDWRAIYRVYVDEENNHVIVFELLGTHSQLYG